jgi:uncharacterized protein (DUF433 family)
VALVLEESPVEAVPLKTDPHGAVRVGGTRVTLDTIVAAYRRGARAEDIAQQFDVLRVDDVYAVLAYYLRHQPEVDAYLAEREVAAAHLRAQLERHFPPRTITSVRTTTGPGGRHLRRPYHPHAAIMISAAPPSRQV